MSLNYYNPHERYRKRAADRIGGFVIACTIIGLIFGFGFWLGQERARYGAGAIKQKAEQLELQNHALEQEAVELRSQAQSAMMRYEQLQKTYEETVPEGPMRDLLDLLRKQLEEGRDPERLAFLIRSARPPRNCSEIETKRFVVSTPSYQGPDSEITLADGSIVITGEGVSATNDKGQAEAWYDPNKTVNLKFTTVGGQAERKSGVLPLHHSVVVSDREYRFTISDGARSFAKVTFDSCDYP